MKLTASVFAASVILLNSSAQANPTSDARKAILAQVRLSDAAFYHGDVAGVQADTTQDYVQITSTGNTYSRDQVSQAIQTLITAMRVKHFSERILSFRLVSPNEAVVSSSSLLIGSLFSRSAGRYVTLNMNSITRGYWVKTGYGWRMKQSRVLSSQKRLG